MICDLRAILDGWDYEPGKISVRKIIGRDGRDKVQTRVDLGVLQFETAGRPDGKRPNGCESLLEHHEQRLIEHVERYGDDTEFVLTSEECRDLRHEAYLYYQRYLSLFVLEEYDGVVTDTDRNLRVIDFTQRYGASEEDREALAAQRTYVLMMQTRAKVYAAMHTDAYEPALAIVDAGLERLSEILAGASESEGDESLDEMQILHDLRREVLQMMPEDASSRLEWEIEAALECEDYERAAALRDRLAERDRPTHPSDPH